jgi:hypothetical protein
MTNCFEASLAQVRLFGRSPFSNAPDFDAPFGHGAMFGLNP